ncbi:MAG: hypothetical protein IJJ11_01735 [Methanosphaera sp.]|nr:hypothetical protein [Methanosphaera sp.]
MSEGTTCAACPCDRFFVDFLLRIRQEKGTASGSTMLKDISTIHMVQNYILRQNKLI